MNKPKLPAQVFHFDLYGKRDAKYDFLSENHIADISWTELHPQEPELFFVPKDFDTKSVYDQGFSLTDLFLVHNAGIVTANDSILINDKKENLISNVNNHYNIKANDNLVNVICYRPFDNKFIYFDTKLIERSRGNLMKHFTLGSNIGLSTIRINKEKEFSSLFIAKYLGDARLSDRFLTSIFPLYLYPDTATNDAFQSTERRPNLNEEIVSQIAEKLGLAFTTEPINHITLKIKPSFAPIDILDYIYAVLHSPAYREKYKEFLKIDFPRVPYPRDVDTFWKLVKLGGKIRQIHLLESEVVEKYITRYPIDGDNKVIKPRYEHTPSPSQVGNFGKVFINETQYFNNVPDVAWNFYIGGYQPAQKWLKDRKERTLEFDDILHYQKIIVALTETDRLMKEIDKIDIE